MQFLIRNLFHLSLITWPCQELSIHESCIPCIMLLDAFDLYHLSESRQHQFCMCMEIRLTRATERLGIIRSSPIKLTITQIQRSGWSFSIHYSPMRCMQFLIRNINILYIAWGRSQAKFIFHLSHDHARMKWNSVFMSHVYHFPKQCYWMPLTFTI